SEGVDPNDGHIGTGSSSYVLQSLGALPVRQLGSLGPMGSPDLTASPALEGGEVRAYQFTVPSNTLVFEARLENRIGNPVMSVMRGTNLPTPFAYYYNCGGCIFYGADGGQGDLNADRFSDANLLTLPNPTPGIYSLVVNAQQDQNNDYPDASCTLKVRAAQPALLPFDGGSTNTTSQPDRTWGYFTINVPANALGWDIRLVNVSEGNPRLVVRRDLLPDGLGTSGSWGYSQNPWAYTGWASGDQWLGGIDWTGDNYDSGGNAAHVSMLAMGMGNPLEPGTYYVGVLADGQSSYTLQSRGIGNGLALPITDLNFAGGSVTNTLAAREGAYYRVVIPP